MTVRSQLLRQLTQSKNRSVERILDEALHFAEPNDQAELCQIIRQRNRRGGWVAMIRHLDRLIPELQEELLANPRELFGPLTEAMGDTTGNVRNNVIELVRRAADPKLVFLLTIGLNDQREEVREQAGGTLLGMVRNFKLNQIQSIQSDGPLPDEMPAGETGPEIAAVLKRAVDFTIRQYRSHRQMHAVAAMLMLERQLDSNNWPLFADPNDELTRVAGGMLRQLVEPTLATAAFLALGSPLKPAALAGFSMCEDLETARAVARESYRLLDPTLRRVAESISYSKMFQAGQSLGPWDEASVLDWLRLIEAMGLPPHEKISWIRQLMEVPLSPGRAMVLKLLAMRVIINFDLPEVPELLLRLAMDAEVRVARSAARYLTSMRRPNWRVYIPNLVRSPHASIRQMAVTVSALSRLERPEDVEARDARENDGEIPDLIDDDTVVQEVDHTWEDDLKLQLQSPNMAEVIDALATVGGQGDLEPFHDEIISLCAHEDAKVVSQAISLVGRLEDIRYKDLLEAAAQHPDARVRANAIEAMEQLQVAEQSQQIFVMLQSRHPRERANAIKALSRFNFGAAQDRLLRMLRDEQSAHRLSALWVVSQLDLLTILRQVAILARRDPEMKVRKRAQEIAQKFYEIANSRN